MINTPCIIINFKTYPTCVGQKAVDLAKICEKVASETGVEIAVAVATPDIYRVSQEVSIPVFAQHVDPIDYGSNTGRNLAENVKEAGAVGTLINHSERRMRLDFIGKAVARCKEAGLSTIICANNVVQGEAVCMFDPDMVAVEPPELIGGDISVSTADPEIIKKSVEEINRCNDKSQILVGAGVKNGSDIKIALDLGAKGVLLASGVAKADDPEAVIQDMCTGITG